VPRIHALLPEKTFQELETPLGPLSEEAELLLERYYLVKLGSLQFCGGANFGLPFWRGLESLALTFPVILWLVRALGAEQPEIAAARAVSIVDHNFAYNPHLGGRFQRLALRLLAQRGELEKLIAWYSR
jgi:lysine-N-methylase